MLRQAGKRLGTRPVKSKAKRYEYFAKRKAMRNNIKINTALTKRRSNLLRRSNQFIEKFENKLSSVNFVYADANGDLKVRLNEQGADGRFVYSFDSLVELAEIVRSLDFVEYESAGERDVESESGENDFNNYDD